MPPSVETVHLFPVAANGPAGGGDVSITMHDMKMIEDDVAIVHGAYKAANGTGHFIRTLVKKDGSWKVATIQNRRRSILTVVAPRGSVVHDVKQRAVIGTGRGPEEAQAIGIVRRWRSIASITSAARGRFGFSASQC